MEGSFDLDRYGISRLQEVPLNGLDPQTIGFTFTYLRSKDSVHILGFRILWYDFFLFGMIWLNPLQEGWNLHPQEGTLPRISHGAYFLLRQMGHSRRCDVVDIASLLEVLWEGETWVSFCVTSSQWPQKQHESVEIRLKAKSLVLCNSFAQETQVLIHHSLLGLVYFLWRPWMDYVVFLTTGGNG